MTNAEQTSDPSKKENIVAAEALEGNQSFICHRNTEDLEYSSKINKISSEKSKCINSQENEAFYLERFTDSEINLKIIKPIQLNVSFEDDLFFIDNEVFDIFSCHKELKKAKIDIEEQLQILWKDFVLDDEKKLSSSGILMKNLLKNFIGAKKVNNIL
jgi:hypothetical protein